MKADGTLLNFKQYAAFGETTLDTLGVTRQGYIGKEKDLENGLGDHGVRKFDYETGRFNSIDALWEKYYGWSPYQYCMNNPIWAKDWDGKVVIVAFSGANLSDEGSTSTAGEIVNSVNSFAELYGLSDVNAIAIPTDLWNTGTGIKEAQNFIKENLSDGEKLIIYGYSKGGEAALDLSKSLGKQKVDLLITVDVPQGLYSKVMDRKVPNNVEYNLNFFQTIRNWNGSIGGKNTAQSENTIIDNREIKMVNHGSIDEKTQKDATNAIINTINK